MTLRDKWTAIVGLVTIFGVIASLFIWRDAVKERQTAERERMAVVEQQIAQLQTTLVPSERIVAAEEQIRQILFLANDFDKRVRAGEEEARKLRTDLEILKDRADALRDVLLRMSLEAPRTVPQEP